MYSLNVPVPGAVERVAADLYPRLTPFDRIRERHTLLCKRFEERRLDRLRERLRPVLAGIGPLSLRITGIDFFERPPQGTAPVVYLAVESDDLRDLHRRLCGEFGAVDGIEGDDYTPHVTLARGGTVADAEALAETDVDPVEWTATELDLWSKEYRESVERVRLRG